MQAAATPFLDVTLGNVITWAVMLLTAGAVWQKTKGAVETLGEEIKKQNVRIDKQEAAIAEVRKENATILLINSRLDTNSQRLESFHARLHEAENKAGKTEVLEVEIKWIKDTLRKAGQKVPE